MLIKSFFTKQKLHIIRKFSQLTIYKPNQSNQSNQQNNKSNKNKNINFGNLNSCLDVISKMSKVKNKPFDIKYKLFGWYLYILNKKDKSYTPLLSSEEEEIINEINEYFDIRKYETADFEEFEEKVNKLEKEVVVKFINNASWIKNESLFLEMKTSLLRMVLFYNFNFSSKSISSSKVNQDELNMFKYLILGIGNLYSRVYKLSSIDELIILDSLDKKLQEILIQVNEENNNQKNNLDFETLITILHVVSKINNHMNGIYLYFISIIYDKIDEDENISFKNRLVLLYITVKSGFPKSLLKKLNLLIESIDVSINENPYEALNVLKDNSNEYLFNNLVYCLVGLYSKNKDFLVFIVSISKLIIKILNENENFIQNLKENHVLMVLLLLSIVHKDYNYSNTEFINELFRKLDACGYIVKPHLIKYLINPNIKSCLEIENNQLSIVNILNLVYTKSTQISYFHSLSLDFFSKYSYIFNLLLYKSEFHNAYSLLLTEININFYYLLLKDSSLIIEYLIIIEYLLSHYDFHIVKDLFNPIINLISDKQISFESHPNSFFLIDFMINSNMISTDYANKVFNISSNEIFNIWYNDLPPKLKCIVIHSSLLKSILTKVNKSEKLDNKRLKSVCITNKSIYMNKFDRLNCKRQYILKLNDLKIKNSTETVQYNQILHNKKALFDILLPFHKVGFLLYDTNNYFKFGSSSCVSSNSQYSYMRFIFKNFILYCSEEYSIKLEIFSSEVIN